MEKKTPEQLFSYKFCEIFKNSIFTEHFQTIASEHRSNMPRAFKTKLRKMRATISGHLPLHFKVACRVQIWKKILCQNSDKFGTVLLKMTLCICISFVFTKNPIILSLFKIATLNFTMYILTILTCTLNIYVVWLHKSNFSKHFFTRKDNSI